MHSHGAANVVGRMRDGERVPPDEVIALQKLETTIDLREQVERIKELTTSNEGPQADAGGGETAPRKSRKASPARSGKARRKAAKPAARAGRSAR
jgi:hypothetical protein